jgi:DNA-binding SARP family transcriptional activator
VRLTLCGAFGLEPRESGAPLPGGQARRALLYLAAHHDRIVRRDVLVDVVWPEHAPQEPEAVLSTLLSRLRPLIAPARLEGTGGGVALRLPEGSSVDLEEAEAALVAAQAALAAGEARGAWTDAAQALAVVEAGYLPEHDADWTRRPRELVSMMRVDALECQANAAAEAGDGALLAAGEQAGRRAVALAPLRESAHEALMNVLAARGNDAEALAVYEQLRRRLLDELGVAPSATLRRRHEVLLRSEPEEAPVVMAGRASSSVADGDGRSASVEEPLTDGPIAVATIPPPRPPLPAVVRALGSGPPQRRGVELAALHRSAEQVLRDGPRVALVLGAPGMGTTRLACLFAAQRYEQGAAVLFGRGEGREGGSAALVEALAPFVDDPGEPEDEAVERACERVVALGRERLVVCVIDDADALDDASARLLRIVLDAPDTRLLCVLTITPDQLRSGSAAWLMLDRLRQVARRDDVVLDELTAAQVGELVADQLPEAPPALAGELWDYVGGHPVLVREAIEELRGHADPLAALREAVPRTLRGSVETRLRRLSAPARKVAEAVAALGPSATAGRIARLLAVSRAELLDAAGEGVDARLLRFEEDGRHLAFKTRVERDVVRQVVGLPELARQAAAAVEAESVAGTHVADRVTLGWLALHAIPALGADDAAGRALGGAEDLLAARAFARAAALADAALAVRPSPPLRAALLVCFGEARRRAAAGPARRAFEQALRLAVQVDDAVLRARAALGLANLGEGSVNRGLGPAAAPIAAALAEAQAALAPEHRDLHAALLARLAVERSWDPDAAGAVQLLARARSFVGPQTPVAVRRVVEQAAIRVDPEPERTAERLVLAGRLLDEARSAHDRTGEVAAIAVRFPLLAELGRFDTLRDELARARRVARSLGDPRLLRWSGEAQAMLSAMAGDYAHADRLSARALREGLDQPVGDEPFALEQVLRRVGRTASAAPADVEALAEIALRRSDLWAVRIGAALLFADVGERERAEGLLAAVPVDEEGLAALDRSNGMALFSWTLLAGALWRLGARDRAAPLRRLLEPFADRHAVLFLPGYLGPVAEGLTQLDLLLGDRDAAAQHREQARAAALDAGALVAAARVEALA